MNPVDGHAGLADPQEVIRALQEELAQTNRGLMALNMELEKRVGASTTELRVAQQELLKTNSELLQITLELEDRVAERTVALQESESRYRRLNAELEQRVAERTAQLQTANQELEAFSYSVSHDLRAPLRAVDGFSEILLSEYQDRFPPEARRYLHLVVENERQMARLVDDLLTFSRSGRQPLSKQWLEPTPLVRRIVEDLQSQYWERSVKVTIAELPPCHADPALLQQVWVNLLSNALKYTCKRTSAIIQIDSMRGVDGETIYRVRDDGVGFDMRYAGKLFGVFQRLNRAEEYEGTGVGLAIVHRIIERHGGRVWAEAEVDKGAAFYFTLGCESSASPEGVSHDAKSI